jgi:CDP-glucose 4,6-dehydratase
VGGGQGAVENVVTPSADFWRGRRVLLTGHTGFKGAWLTLWLTRLGAKVHGLSLAPRAPRDLWVAADLGRFGSTRIGDVRDPAVVRAAFDEARPQVVIHMAAQSLVQAGYDDPVGTFATNVMGTVNVLEAARRSDGLEAFVNITSDKAYENREQIWAYREDEPMGGADPYSASKGCAELVASAWRRSFFSGDGPRLASARAGNVIGGGDWAVDRLVPDCVRAFAAGREVLIRNPLATRPWQHVLEPLSGYLVLAQSLVEKGAVAAEGWNFGPDDADAWTVGQVAERLVALWGEDARWARDPAGWPHEAMLLRVDAAKARSRLGWRPRLSAAEALKWSIDWYRAEAGGADVAAYTQAQIEAYEALS